MILKPKAYVFDVYGTLFDVHSVSATCEKWFPGKGESISQLWREKQIEYTFLRQMMGRYQPFDFVTEESLCYAAEANGENASPEAVTDLLRAYRQLSLFNESADVLKSLKDKNKQLLVLSNGTEEMLLPLLEQAGINTLFDAILSVDQVKQYKTSPAAYSLILEKTGLQREEIMFLSSNGWDITGAKSFGFQSTWINRKGMPQEKLGFKPDFEFHSLSPVMER
ncbi:haloacid dehalogenase type II [Alteribacillus sp. HJP-4]|uniref:haloacid dehalogenase type II n=1 Tax=Alteribacillus sp. HJP-4 TaxID=2775394 RepID=UPI0035CD1425